MLTLILQGLGGDNLNEGTFKIDDVYLFVNGVTKVQCYARFNHFWGRRGAGFNITSDEVDLSGVTIDTITLHVTVLAEVHSGGGSCQFCSKAQISASYRQSGFFSYCRFSKIWRSGRQKQ